MQRKLLSIALAVSFTLCVAVCVLWVRSYWVMDLVGRTAAFGTASDGGSHERFVRSNLGELVLVGHEWKYHRTLVLDDDEAPTPLPLRWSADVSDPGFRVAKTAVQPPYGRHFAGFAYGRFDRGSRSPDGSSSQRRQDTFSVPHWFLALVFGLPPAFVLIRLRMHRRRARAGLCPACGYDLRESHDRCPECGVSRWIGGPAAA